MRKHNWNMQISRWSVETAREACLGFHGGNRVITCFFLYGFFPFLKFEAQPHKVPWKLDNFIFWCAQVKLYLVNLKTEWARSAILQVWNKGWSSHLKVRPHIPAIGLFSYTWLTTTALHLVFLTASIKPAVLLASFPRYFVHHKRSQPLTFTKNVTWTFFLRKNVT